MSWYDFSMNYHILSHGLTHPGGLLVISQCMVHHFHMSIYISAQSFYYVKIKITMVQHLLPLISCNSTFPIIKDFVWKFPNHNLIFIENHVIRFWTQMNSISLHPNDEQIDIMSSILVLQLAVVFSCCIIYISIWYKWNMQLMYQTSKVPAGYRMLGTNHRPPTPITWKGQCNKTQKPAVTNGQVTAKPIPNWHAERIPMNIYQ